MMSTPKHLRLGSFCLTVCVAVALIAVAVGAWARPSLSRPNAPNVILIVADDLGFMDITANNPATFHETPNLDRLAGRGMRFTNGYAAAPVCSPTRACLLTGKHPARLRMTNVVLTKPNVAKAMLPAANREFLNVDEITLAEAFHDAGYRTLLSGKWHLGVNESAPANHGFESATVRNGQMYHPRASVDLPKDRDPKLSGRIAADAVRFIEAAADKPFFAYLSFPAPHLPLEAPQGLVRKYEEKVASMDAPQPATGNPIYAAMIEQLDEAVGSILDVIDSQGITERTIIVFTSDNGGLEWFSTSNAPLRAGKGTLYEGGIRVPLIIAVPGVTPAGSVGDTPAFTADLYPTLLELAGLPSRPAQHLDGASLVPVLRGETVAERSLIWHFPHYSVRGPAGAIRCGDWKLVEWFEDGRIELFNLRDDIGESVNLVARHPEQARLLRRNLVAWRGSVQADMPKANPGWQGTEGD